VSQGKRFVLSLQSGLIAPVNFALEHIGLAAQDPTALKEWCLRTFGASVVFADGKSPPAFFVRLPGGLLIEIYSSRAKPERPFANDMAGWRHLALRVNSIEAARNNLLAKGVEFEPVIKPAGGGGRVLFFKDPEGNLWHLVERPADVTTFDLAPPAR
jgi:glyoxylase I family protein